MSLTLESLQSLLIELSWFTQLFVAILGVTLTLLPIIRSFTFYHTGMQSAVIVLLRAVQKCSRTFAGYLEQQLWLEDANESNDQQVIEMDICLLPRTQDANLVSGLVNTGNSCFLNSVLQALSSLPHLQCYLDYILSSAGDRSLPVTRSLLKTLRKLSQPQWKRQSFRPREIVRAIASNRMVVNREQQDAQELFQFIASAIDTESQTVKLRERIGSGLKDILRESGHGERHNSTPSYSPGRFENPFTGLLAHRLSCMQCGYTEAIRHFSFNDVQLTLPNSVGLGTGYQVVLTSPQRYTTLEECLQQLTSMEYLNDATCRKCSLINTTRELSVEIEALRSLARCAKGDEKRKQLKKLVHLDRLRRDIDSRLNGGRIGEEPKEWDGNIVRIVSRMSTKQAMFAKPPKVLNLHLSRSSYHPSGFVYKNKCHVVFPEMLDLTPYCTTGTLNTQPHLPISTTAGRDNKTSTIYRLMSIIVHYGSHNYGHFIAFKRRILMDCHCSACQGGSHQVQCLKDQWYRISDEHVDPCSIDEVLSANPYMLIYERIDPEPIPPTMALETLAAKLSLNCATDIHPETVSLLPLPEDLDPAEREASDMVEALLAADATAIASTTAVSSSHTKTTRRLATGRWKAGPDPSWPDKSQHQKSTPVATY